VLNPVNKIFGIEQFFYSDIYPTFFRIGDIIGTVYPTDSPVEKKRFPTGPHIEEEDSHRCVLKALPTR
jgi:hypothetical protein